MNKSKVKICVCQLNTVVGDIRENSAAVLLKAQEAADNGAEIIIFPELNYRLPAGGPSVKEKVY